MEKSSKAVLNSTVVTRSRKRPLADCYENGEEWAKQIDFPPHLIGLMEKVTNMIADDIQTSGQYYRRIAEEAALKSADIGKTPRCKVTGKLVMNRRRSVRLLCRQGVFVKTLMQSIASFIFHPS